MASYRYERDIDPEELKPHRKREYTRKEKWNNWWDYNLKWVIAGGIAAAFLLYCFIGQAKTVQADYNIAVVAPYYMPEDTVNALQTEIAKYGEDLNGDGEVVVTVNVYTRSYDSDTFEGESQTDAYLTIAGDTKLIADVQGAMSAIFILYDPAGFENETGCLAYTDGSLPDPDSDDDWWNMVYRWTDCPVLAGLDLGEYAPDTAQVASGDSQEYMSHLYVAVRGAWNSGTAESIAEGQNLWSLLSAGAVSTVTEADTAGAADVVG